MKSNNYIFIAFFVITILTLMTLYCGKDDSNFVAQNYNSNTSNPSTINSTNTNNETTTSSYTSNISGAKIVINEIYFDAPLTGHNFQTEYVELKNIGNQIVYLDGFQFSHEGLLLSGSQGTEGIFVFPGNGSSYPLSSGQTALIYKDPNTTDAYWLTPSGATYLFETYSGSSSSDTIHSGFITMELISTCSSAIDFYLNALDGDGIFIASSTDTDCSDGIILSSIIDGVNFRGSDSSIGANIPSLIDSGIAIYSTEGKSLTRIQDTDNSLNDFTITNPSPGY